MNTQRLQTDESMLDALARHGSVAARYQVANNEAASDRTLRWLGRQNDDVTRWLVACNIGSPVDLLRELSTDVDKQVASCAAQTLRLLQSEFGVSVDRGLNPCALLQVSA